MIAIIDGDVLAYQACKPRWEKKARIEEGTSFISLDDEGKRIPLEFTEEEDKEYLEQSWNNFKIELQILLDNVYCTDYLMAVKGDFNFRYDLYPEYKLNRHANAERMNHFVPVIRKRAAEEGLAIEAHGREADDYLRIWAEECRKHDLEYIICSIDKDLKCIPGKHFFMHKKEIADISELEAMRNYYQQLLKGDTTDNIPGVPKIGEVKAAKILANCMQEEEFQEKVVEQYILAYQDDWYDFLLSNAKMIHIQKHEYDYFKLDWNIVKELR